MMNTLEFQRSLDLLNNYMKMHNLPTELRARVNNLCFHRHESDFSLTPAMEYVGRTTRDKPHRGFRSEHSSTRRGARRPPHRQRRVSC